MLNRSETDTSTARDPTQSSPQHRESCRGFLQRWQHLEIRKTVTVKSKLDIPRYGYGSIPINTIFSGMNIHLPAILMFTRGTRFWHTATSSPTMIINDHQWSMIHPNMFSRIYIGGLLAAAHAIRVPWLWPWPWRTGLAGRVSDKLWQQFKTCHSTAIKRYGYGSIPIKPIKIPFFRGMNIHKSQLFWCELQGVLLVLTHCHIEMVMKSWFPRIHSF